VEFRPYLTFGVCNPPVAYLERQQEPMIGTKPPCTAIVQQTDPGAEIAAVGPVASMAGGANPASTAVAKAVHPTSKPSQARPRPERRLALGDRSVAVVESWTDQPTLTEWMPESLTA
jgi:hypothetical protein